MIVREAHDFTRHCFDEIGAALNKSLMRAFVALLSVLSPGLAIAECDIWKGLACFTVFSSCGFTAGFGGIEPYVRCVDTLSNHWCTECVTDKGIQRGKVICPNGGDLGAGGLKDKLSDCPGYGSHFLSVQSTYAGRAVAPNQDGRLEVAFVDSGGQPNHFWQETAAGVWSSNAVSFPGSVHAASFPALIRRPDGTLDVFVVTSSGTVAHTRQLAANVNWQAWTDLGGSFLPLGVAANVSPSGLVTLAAVGRNKQMYVLRERHNGEVASWETMGGSFAGAPVIAVNADGRFEIFAVSANSQLVHAWQNLSDGAFGSWSVLGTGKFAGTPAVGRNLDQRLEVFVSATSGSLSHAWQNSPNGGWSEFHTPVGTHAHDPAVALNIDGTLETFVIGVTDHALWHSRQVAPNTGWSDWESLGGQLLSTPAVALAANGSLGVIAVGRDGALWEVRQVSPASKSWTEWRRIGGAAKPSLF